MPICEILFMGNWILTEEIHSILIKSTLECFYMAVLSSTIPILQIKLKHRQAKSLAQVHTAGNAKLRFE